MLSSLRYSNYHGHLPRIKWVPLLIDLFVLLQGCTDVDRGVDEDVENLLYIEEETSQYWIVRYFKHLVHNYRVPNYNFAQICETVRLLFLNWKITLYWSKKAKAC